MAQLLDAEKYKEKPAIMTAHGEQFTYEHLAEACTAVGSFLRKGKNLVLICAQNNVETVAGYLAAVEFGNTAMLVDANLDAQLYKNLIEQYQPDFIWGPRGSKNASCLCVYNTYCLMDCGNAKKAELHPGLCVLLSTSGSTGTPKFVKLTKENITANARSIATYLKLSETERPITTLPLHYSYGLSVLNSHLLAGSCLLLTDMPVVKKAFWDFFKSAGATSIAGVPYTYEMLKMIGFHNMELPSLRSMTQAGGKMDVQLIMEYAELSRQKKFDFYVMYGATEATARISYLEPQFNIVKAGSIGKAIPNGNICVINDSGNIITTPHTQGELVYQGPNVMMGYACCRADLAQGDELGGTLKTGDIAYFDEEEFFYICGRKSRFLKLLGKRISLADIETNLKNLGHQCICGGDDNMLRVAYHGNALENSTDVFRAVRKEIMSRYGIPPDLITTFHLDDIPRNTAGKINYHEVFTANRTQ